MNGRLAQLDSAHLGRPVHLWSYGWYGLPVLAFPSAGGMAHEWEQNGMVEALAPWLGAGRLKLYCPESNVAEAWTRVADNPLDWRLARHAAYEAFVMETLVPAIRADCGGWQGPILTIGCSLGASYAALFALKQPEVFNRALCMSGRYLATELTKGEWRDELYFHSPLHFVPNLQGAALDRVRRNTHLSLVVGQGAFEEGCTEETIALGQLFSRKGIPSILDVWGVDSRHDWPWWRRQLLHHVQRMFP